MLVGIALIALGFAVGFFGRWQRQCAQEELRGGRPTEWPLGARHQLVGAWVLLVFALGFIWSNIARLVGIS